eukprot:TRINITY_DN3224_c0_g1_i5.p1 TRINITY_DN3224_c0_g1~~TRINITY_DN3224_c0_g1_i5.p1  ORF type:complete len:338 (-),score=65.48 TRINITY_DN3224_c0_g1_i5:191-1204(-)
MEKKQNEPEESSGTKNLQFSEVLYLLSKKVNLGYGIPDKYDYPPWRLQTGSAPCVDKINPMLNYSIKVQSGVIPKSEEFSEFILSNSSLAVAGMLQYLLGHLDVPSEITFGVLKWAQDARSSEDDFEGIPHIWLSIGDIPVDNTYVAFPPTADNLEYFYECKKVNSYLKENPLETKMRLFLGQEEDEESKEVYRHNIKVLQTYSFKGHILKYLAISLLNPELNPGLKLYSILMLEYLKNNFSISPPKVEDKMSKECWSCKKEYTESDQLRTCTGCKVAKYCDRDCQRQEWKVHKLLHQELEFTKKLLLENAAADEAEQREIEQLEQTRQQMNSSKAS